MTRADEPDSLVLASSRDSEEMRELTRGARRLLQQFWEKVEPQWSNPQSRWGCCNRKNKSRSITKNEIQCEFAAWLEGFQKNISSPVKLSIEMRFASISSDVICNRGT